MMEQPGYPKELLGRPISERIGYFVAYTMRHPHLLAAFMEVMQAIYKAPGTSLIFIVGATGVGKTTLLRRLVHKVTESTIEELEINRGKIPIFGIEAKSPELSQFDWKDFYIRLLKALNEPLVEKKINYQSCRSKWRDAAESALINRCPDAFYIDEAHHLAMLPSGRKLKDQPETLKSLANLGQVKIIPTGTYDLLPLIDLGDQLCRRTKTIHFKRYRVEYPEEERAFKSVVQTFQHYLPLTKTPDLLRHWEFLYERSLGCVGMLKDWLCETLYDVLDTDEKARTLTLKDLKRHARPVAQCLKILKSIQEGEQQMEESLEDLEKLRTALKLRQKSPSASTINNLVSPETSSPPSGSVRGKKRVGQPSPRRYQVGENIDEQEIFNQL